MRAHHHEKYVQIITEAYFLRVETLMKNYPIAQEHVFMSQHHHENYPTGASQTKFQMHIHMTQMPIQHI
jgi:hypothetical protein